MSDQDPQIPSMNYYFLNDQNEVIGPIDSDTLHGFFHDGTIEETTLVAQEGDNEWKPYRVKYPKIEVLTPHKYPNPPLGIRDQMVGIKKFTERSYTIATEINLISNEVESFFSKSLLGTGRQIIKRENAELIEITFEYNKDTNFTKPILVSIAKLGRGFRISFLREGLAMSVVKQVPTNFLLSLVAPSLAILPLIGLGEAALAKRDEGLFWDYIESRIEELSLNENSRSEISLDDTTEKLSKLWQLKQEGALTLEEFQAQKQALFKSGVQNS